MDDDIYGYIDDLKVVAQCHGYSSDEIDCLLEEGFSPFEIEEFCMSIKNAGIGGNSDACKYLCVMCIF